MMSLADGTVTPVEMLAGDVIPDDAQTTIAILVRNFPAQFRIGSSGNCLTANNDKTVSSVLCSGGNEQLWRYNIASGCLHPATKAGGNGNCLGGTGNAILTDGRGAYFDGQRITFDDRYLRVVGSNVSWKGDPSEA